MVATGEEWFNEGRRLLGQAFADEVFRVYRRKHPSGNISLARRPRGPGDGMIQRNIAGNPEDPVHEHFSREYG